MQKSQAANVLQPESLSREEAKVKRRKNQTKSIDVQIFLNIRQQFAGE